MRGTGSFILFISGSLKAEEPLLHSSTGSDFLALPQSFRALFLLTSSV